jgi:4-hydroxybenzoate polyprenyltransferase
MTSLLNTKTSIGFAATAASLVALPTRKELQACWELCRLHNNIGFWVVWLPTGKD